MSGSLKPFDSELTENSDHSAAALTETLSAEPKPETPFGKLTDDLDSESSGDELTAFDRERALSDTDDSDTEKAQDPQAPSEPPADPPASDPVSAPDAPAEPKELVTSPQNREDETPAESDAKLDAEDPELSGTSISVTLPVSEQTETNSEDVVSEKTDDQKDTSKKEEKVSHVEPEDKFPSHERGTQTKEDNAETEKAPKYPQNRDYSREKGGRWNNNNEDTYRDGRRDRGKARSYREDRGRREVFTSYGHDDRFYTNPDHRSRDPELGLDLFQDRPSPVRIYKGSRGRGGEGKWKHDKFNEDEQGPIDAEVSSRQFSYSPPQSVGQSHYSEKKGRGRGDRKPQYGDGPLPVPGFTRHSPRQERRGRGSKPRRDDYDRTSVNPRSKGRGNTSRHNSGYYNDESESVYLSKPIVFVSQNKRVQSPIERASTHNAKPSLSSNDIIRIGESDYIQSSASTPLPTIPVISRTENELASDRSGQSKYGAYNRASDRDSKPVIRSPYVVGLGRGNKGKFLSQVASLQDGQEHKKPYEATKPHYGKENIPKNDLNEAFPLSPESAAASAYKDKPQHKPQRYSAQRLKQAHSNANTTATATSVVDPSAKLASPVQIQVSSSSNQNPLAAQEQGLTVSMRLGELPPAEGHIPLMEVPYSEFYPSPFKEEMFGNQMSPMHPYNIMPDGTILQDFILPPEVMKEGDFQHMQFPPFMPQEMAMNIKGAPNMMGGPFMGSPQLAPEYMMTNEVPPNMQTDLYLPMQSYYPPI